MRSRGKLLTLALICIAGLVAAAVAYAAVTGPPRGTAIISPPGGSPGADGPSDDTNYTDDGTRASHTPTVDPIVGTPRPMDNIEFSQDSRQVRYAAFQSSANNLAGTTGDGHDHIYLFKRKKGGKTTSAVLDGTLKRVDPNKGGDSVKPSLDGQTVTGDRFHAPNCLVFQSTSNLTSADNGGKWAIFLYRIGSGNFTQISPAGADARDGVVDGKCRTVTFEQGGEVFVRTIGGGVTPITDGDGGFNPDQQTDGKGVAYDRDGQVWYRSFQKKFKKGTVVGGEKLVSKGPSGPGNGDSSMPAVNDNGAYIAFESKADNLCNGSKAYCGTTDKNGHITDVFRRTMSGKGAPTKDVIQMISYDGKENFQSDLDSDQVKITGAGEQACFRSFGVQTHNQKFRPDRHTGPFQHIYYWNFPRERMIGAFSGESKEGRTSNTELQRDDQTAAFNWSCAISNRGNFIGFSSDTEHMAGDTNGHTFDMFIRFMGGSDEGQKGDLG